MNVNAYESFPFDGNFQIIKTVEKRQLKENVKKLLLQGTVFQMA